MMLLIYAHTISPRLLYTVDFFCTDLYGIPYRCTDRLEDLAAYPGPAICYHATNLSPSAFHIVPVDLLFESDIRPQTIDCFMFNGQQAFWGTTGGDWPFDIWAATFYLISRYEEYLPYQTDEYGRYSHTNSLSFQKGFLHLPLVEMWARDMREAIQQKYPNLIFSQRSFRFLPTYDIDLAWSYRHKGWWRNLGGALRRPGSIGPRLAVLLGQQPDPFDSYGWLHQLHQTYRWQPIYFFLVAAQNGPYDKNILPDQPALQQLIQDHANHYPIGLHPSWQSTDAPALLNSEKQVLEKIAGQSVIHSRQHYIRFHLPVGYRWLLQTGITNDYSMGYGSINGYRASVAQPFNWFDLAHNQSTHLRVHPFCFMDANSFYEQRLTPQQATEELQRYITVCKALNTRLCTIWHNNFLGSDPLYRGWRQVYETLAQSL